MSGFVKPEKKKEGSKFLFFGEAGSGKTPTGLSFPNIALIDADSGSMFYDLDNVELTTGALSYKDLADDLDELEMDDELFDSIGTFVVDSITRLHETLSIAMNKVAENRAVNAGRDADAEGLSFREFGKMKTYYEEFYGRMVTYAKSGANLVFIAEQKDKNENKGGEIRKVGVMPDAQRGIEYDFDVVVRTFQETRTEGGKTTTQPKGEVLKDRTGTFNVGEIIDKPHYNLWKEAVESAQQGRKRSREEIKSVTQAAKDEVEVIDDGETLRKKAIGIIKNLDDKGKDEAKTKLADAIGTHQVHQVSDIEKLQQAVKILEDIK